MFPIWTNIRKMTAAKYMKTVNSRVKVGFE